MLGRSPRCGRRAARRREGLLLRRAWRPRRAWPEWVDLGGAEELVVKVGPTSPSPWTGRRG
eukprot:4177303-Pyramimonas_sp.AAC.1